jgi:methionine synthase / methylenetetrahydrofolate reductase(NADPH)
LPSSDQFLLSAQQKGLLFDGAIGTQLYARGIFLNQCFEQINLTQPALVKQIHREYIEAGAQVITTNTFGGNQMKLAKHGLENETENTNRAAVKLARSVAGPNIYVAGSIGPTGINLDELSRPKGREALQCLENQMRILVDSGVDLLCLETFTVLQELEMAILLAKQFKVPVVALYTFQSNGLGSEGQNPKVVGQRLIEAGADIIGSNCGGGPDLLFKVTIPMIELGVPVLAQANAGRPELIEGRSIYIANPEYFSVYAKRLLKAGIKIIGGCCGTSPQHIRAMSNATRMFQQPSAHAQPILIGSKFSLDSHNTNPVISIDDERASLHTPLAQRSALGYGITHRDFVTSVEINPPVGFSLDKKLKAAQALYQAGVSTINIADGPRASLRMSNIAMAQHIMQHTPLSPITHICCRDRSFLGLQSHILGAHVMGIRNLVVITGDPPKMGPYPHSSGVYDVDSIELLRIIQGYNHGIDPAGKEMPQATAFVCATGAEPAAIDYERELDRLIMKKNAGAELVMTQPVYDSAQALTFLKHCQSIGLPIMLGLCPLASHRNALFLNNNVPGMQVPTSILKRMEQAEEQGQAEAEGIMIAREALEELKDYVQGAYIMPPFGRYKTALKVLEGYITPPTSEMLP